MLIPKMILKQLYNFGSLENVANGVKFTVKNRLSDAKFTELIALSIAGKKIDLDKISIDQDGEICKAKAVDKKNPIDFPLRATFDVIAEMDHLEMGKHQVEIKFRAKPFGKLTLTVDDSIAEKQENVVTIPRNNKDDYSEEIIQERQNFVEDYTGTKLNHVKKYSFDPHIANGNCEHFTGVAQVPMGFAGPIKINGEHAKEEYIIPMATAEGTLVASYNRGIKVLNQSGGVKCTVQRDSMQRAPVFIFDDARGARDFVDWCFANFKKIAEEAEATTSVGRLQYLDPYLASKFAYLRFNFATGDAAGQNMVGRATFAACSWILEAYKEHKIVKFYLESNLATDKKASQVNIMRTRGKRVTAEATIPRDVLIQLMRVTPENLVYHGQVANVGAILSGANNNGLHSANGITAMFIATGQDVANVSESSAGILHSELTPNGDLYISITIPSLIIATYGGGTKLPTQRECLELLGVYGKGGVLKFAEIIAGVVLAGEISLASAISSLDWVSSHEKYGRNR